MTHIEITKEQYETLSPDVKSQMNLHITKVSYAGTLSEKDVKELCLT